VASEWFYSVAGRKLGPVGSSELKRLADSSVLSPTDLVWKEGLPAWVAASKIKGLFPQHAATTTPPALPPVPVAVTETPAAIPTAAAGGLHPQRLAVAISAAVGGAATFMPWATLPLVGAIDGTVGDGWITLGLFAGVLVAAFLGRRSQQLGGWAQLAGIVLSTTASGIGLAKIMHFKQAIASIGDDAAAGSLEGAMAGLMANATRLGFGLYVLVVAGIAAVVSILALRSKANVTGKATPLPLHLQRIVLLLLALTGAGATFIPWVEPVDAEAPVKIDASRSSPERVARARASNIKYTDEMAAYLGQKANTLNDLRGAPGTSFSGLITLALFGVVIPLSLQGVLRAPLRGWLQVLIVALPLAASGIGAWEIARAGQADRVVRAAVLQVARENGLEEAALRLDRPVIKIGAGLWTMAAAGLAAAITVPLLSRVGRPQECPSDGVSCGPLA
jgi:hypothetical protein